MSRPTLSFLACAAILTLAVGCGGGGSPVVEAAAPVIDSIEPASGGVAGGTEIVIRGSNLANRVAGEYQVLIGGQPADGVEVIDGTQVECKTPAGTAGAADVEIVTVEGVGGVPGGFMFYPPPTVASITPNEGTRDGGTEVTVTGTGFTANNPGETICLIELKELENIEVIDDTTLTGLTPSSWTETFKDVTVVNRNGSGTLNASFTYVGPIPLIDSITPDLGARGGGTFVTIVGQYFTEAGGELSVRFGSAEASLVTRIDDQTLTCVTPVGANPGWTDVSVGNNNGESTLTDGFYYIPAPVPTSVTPSEGPFDGGTSVIINGISFTGGGPVSVLFGANPALNLVVVDDTTITCDTPQGAALGSVDVVVQNGNGVGQITDGFTYLAPAFWWEDTWGAAHSSPGDGVVYAVSIQNGFPFFATTWNSVNAISDGHLDFGASNTNYSTSNQLFTFPHISMMGQDMLTSTANNIYATNHIPGRTIITYDNVPEYSTVGANSVQVHLHASGIFAVLYKNATFHATTTWTATGMVAVNPGGGTSVPVDWTSGPQSGGPTDALNEGFSSTSDLANSYLVFVPNSGGGYDSTHTSGVPTDPNP